MERPPEGGNDRHLDRRERRRDAPVGGGSRLQPRRHGHTRPRWSRRIPRTNTRRSLGRGSVMFFTSTSVDSDLRDAYLARLGLEAEPPSVEALRWLHRRQVERVPYETMW